MYTKLPSVLSLNGDADFEFFAVAFVVSVIFITVVLSTILLLLVRRYVASRAKIRNLTTPDTEASKDYQSHKDRRLQQDEGFREVKGFI
ncbi:hypothetical protein J6590_025110 [Homalodisca vitripennis]|nr:hypothetical protein J6590_025110 [Homalodisca vitripennis]